MLITDAILNNTDVRIEARDDVGVAPYYEPCGKKLEVAMIKFLMDNNENVYEQFIYRNRQTAKIV
jgi:hypothetical protein